MRRARLLSASFVTAGLLSMGSLALYSTAAYAAPGNGAQHVTQHCTDVTDPACGINPVVTGPAPPFVNVSSNCPSFVASSAWELNLVSGSAVFHFTSNNNGDWGGGTMQGQAVLSTPDGTAQYSGHVTQWFGQGNNSGGQTEQGFTLSFNGSGPAGKISIHANGHTTTNNAGTTTSNFNNGTVTCS